ncbi:MAG: hypothetical protein ACI4RR_06850 [Eubacterium sp.]
MLFRRKKKQANQATEKNENTSTQKKTIVDVENAIERETDSNKLALLCTAAGLAYRYGDHGAEPNFNKAEYYFKKGMENASPDCYFGLGELYISAFPEDVNKFSEGIVMMCHCFSQGNENARPILQFIIDEKIIPGYNSVEQLVLDYEAST